VNIIQEIEDYAPFDEKESMDKEVILDFLRKNEDAFDRTNEIGHMTASCFIVDPKLENVLLCYHNIYKSWSWLGGHADGQQDLLQVALKEAKEESGLKNVVPFDSKIFSLETLCVNGHFRKGIYVSSHLHFNVTYLLIGSLDEPLIVNPDENSRLGWFALDDLLKVSTEPWFVENIYPKLIEKTKRLRKMVSVK
jgi:8-oxo-dGTP pyrophosphatase MutT (NUDIX family)